MVSRTHSWDGAPPLANSIAAICPWIQVEKSDARIDYDFVILRAATRIGNVRIVPIQRTST